MQEAMREYLYAFKDSVLDKNKDILDKYKELLETEPQEFHDEIHHQFYEKMADRLAEELAENFNTNPEEIAMLLERFNINNWMKGNEKPGRRANVW